MLISFTLDTIFKPAFTTMSFSLPVATLAGNNFCALSSSHTQMACFTFSQGSNQDNLHQGIVALNEALSVKVALIFSPFFNVTNY